jgi:hypothetical protein
MGTGGVPYGHVAAPDDVDLAAGARVPRASAGSDTTRPSSSNSRLNWPIPACLVAGQRGQKSSVRRWRSTRRERRATP